MTWVGSDRERLAAFRRGDRTVLAEVYARYAPELARALAQGYVAEGVRLTGPRAALELEDVLQEAFVKAFADEARAAFDGARPFGAWLATIARNLLLDRHRRTSREPALDPPSPSANSPETEALRRELADVYRDFLEGLDPRDRQVLQLRLEKDAPRREVSEKTGLSAMQVRLREARLRKALAQVLRRSGWGAGRAP